MILVVYIYIQFKNFFFLTKNMTAVTWEQTDKVFARHPKVSIGAVRVGSILDWKPKMLDDGKFPEKPDDVKSGTVCFI